MKRRIITISNQKGGVGKTTASINIAAGLRLLGRNPLLVDLDPQSNLTAGMGFNPDKLSKTLYDIFMKTAKLSDVILCKNGTHIVPSSLALFGLENLSATAGGGHILKEALEDVNGNFDYVIIDAPPSLGVIATNGFIAADEIFIPINPGYFSLLGITQLLKAIEATHKYLAGKAQVTGVFLSEYDARKNVDVESLDYINKVMPDKVFKTFIRTNTKISEAQSRGLSIFDYDKNSNGAEDYMALCEEIISQETKDGRQ